MNFYVEICVHYAENWVLYTEFLIPVYFREQFKAETYYDLYFDSMLLTMEDLNGTNVHSLYPYRTTELFAILIYEWDYKRDIGVFSIPTSVKVVVGLILLFLCFATIVLWIIRRKLQRPRNSIISAFFECLVPFTGGGSVQMRHKLERWFFAVMYMSSFFIIAVFAGDILDSLVRIQIQSISTFEQLAEINPPIYIRNEMALHSEEIREMLKRKMTPNIDYRGFDKVKSGTRVHIMDASEIELMRILLSSNSIDFDVLKESLGDCNELS